MYSTGISADGTLDVAQCPANWKQHLKSAGVSKKQMLDPAFNREVVKTLSALAPLASLQLGMVKFDFAGKGDRHLSVAAGEMVTVLQQYPTGWSHVSRSHDNQTGMVPTDYLDTAATVEPVSPSKSTPRKPAPPKPLPRNTKTPSTYAEAPPAQPIAVELPPCKPAYRKPPPRKPEPRPVPELLSVPEPAPTRPPINALLASIQAGKVLNKVEENNMVASPAEEMTPPIETKTEEVLVNPFLASIQNGVLLNKAAPIAVQEKKPNLLDSIKGGGTQLRKVEQLPPDDRPPVPPQQASALVNVFSEAIAKIRLATGGEESDDEDSDGNWSD
jgi:hypothetical protein